MSNLKSPNAVRSVQFRFSKKHYLRPLATPLAALRVRSRLGKFLWPTIFWNGAWHFTNMGDVAAVNLKFSTYAHAHEVEQLTEVTYKNQMATFKKCPLADLPRAIQQDRYAHLLAYSSQARGSLIQCAGRRSRSEDTSGSHGCGAITICPGCLASHAPHQLSDELAMM